MRRRHLLLLLALLPTMLVALVQGTAQAGDPDTLTVFTQDLNDVAVPRFAFEVDGEPCLADTVVEVPGTPQVDLQLDDPNSGMFTLPGAAPGEYLVEVTCTTDSGTEEGTGFIDFGYVVVDKVVVGDAPADAQFVVQVSCDADVGASPTAESYAGESAPSGEGFGPDAIQASLTYGPSGGQDTLVHYRSQSCTIEETQTGGAQTVTVATEDCGELLPVAPAEGTTGGFDVYAAASCTQTVTNEFAPAEVEPDDVAPDVVAATPTFTG